MPQGTWTDGHVGVIELQDPPHNFLSADQVKDIADAIDAFAEDPDIRCVVVCAQGRSFCAGAKFGGGGEEMASNPADLYAQAARLVETPIPWIAAVQGPAIGGGLGLAVAATLRVTCPEARFSANFVKLGIHQGFGLSVTLPLLVGQATAARILLGAKRYNGEEAVELGLADVCVPQEELRDTAMAMAREIGDGAPLAVRSIYATLRSGLGAKVLEITRHEAAEQARLMRTDDAREGIASVNERRPGNFTGT